MFHFRLVCSQYIHVVVEVPPVLQLGAWNLHFINKILHTRKLRKNSVVSHVSGGFICLFSLQKMNNSWKINSSHLPPHFTRLYLVKSHNVLMGLVWINCHQQIVISKRGLWNLTHHYVFSLDSSSQKVDISLYLTVCLQGGENCLFSLFFYLTI